MFLWVLSPFVPSPLVQCRLRQQRWVYEGKKLTDEASPFTSKDMSDPFEVEIVDEEDNQVHSLPQRDKSYLDEGQVDMIDFADMFYM